jgi:hypothetical protein
MSPVRAQTGRPVVPPQASEPQASSAGFVHQLVRRRATMHGRASLVGPASAGVRCWRRYPEQTAFPGTRSDPSRFARRLHVPGRRILRRSASFVRRIGVGVRMQCRSNCRLCTCLGDRDHPTRSAVESTLPMTSARWCYETPALRFGRPRTPGVWIRFLRQSRSL